MQHMLLAPTNTPTAFFSQPPTAVSCPARGFNYPPIGRLPLHNAWRSFLGPAFLGDSKQQSLGSWGRVTRVRDVIVCFAHNW